MPVIAPQMKITIAPPADPRWTALFQELEQNIQVEVPDGFLTGGIVTSLPTSNIGPVLFNNLWYVWDDTVHHYVLQQTTAEIGQMSDFAFSLIDTSKWLICDGRAIPRAAPYDQLFAKIATIFGNGDGSTTFNIPDRRGRVSVGAGTGVIPGSGSIPSTALTPRALGDIIGEENHALKATEVAIPNIAIDDQATTLNVKAGVNIGIDVTAGTSLGAPHNNIQPSLVVVTCIRFA
jgi:microcystin-dependent protein